ncbi:MAG: proton extrusion protein PcxA [Microcystaceae cyanobacterium]
MAGEITQDRGFWHKLWGEPKPEQALEQAFQAALKIKAIEDQYFQGQKVSAQSTVQDTLTITYLTTEVKGYFQGLNANISAIQKSYGFLQTEQNLSPKSGLLEIEAVRITLEKLQFVEAMMARYPHLVEYALPPPEIQAAIAVNDPKESEQIMFNKQRKTRQKQQDNSLYPRQKEGLPKPEIASKKTGVLPRSFSSTLDRLKREISPQSGETEQQVLDQYRNSRQKTTLSIKFLLMLIIIPLLTHQLTKTFFLTPLVEKYFDTHLEIVFINQSMEREAFDELKQFEESLRFRGFMNFDKRLTPEETDEKMKDKAEEIAESYRHGGANAISNIFADLFSLIAFVIVLVTSRREIEMLKQFIDELVYGLSDSAKAFLIILFTDMFVGFHSTHGWEVILENLARHFGLPENRDFNFLFIATFPVILDTVFKYWIFRYLNSISPSSVATYRNMNE